MSEPEIARDATYESLRADLERDWRDAVAPEVVERRVRQITMHRQDGRPHQANAEAAELAADLASYEGRAFEKFIAAIESGRYDAALREGRRPGIYSDTAQQARIDASSASRCAALGIEAPR